VTKSELEAPSTNPDGKHLSCWLLVSEQRILADWGRQLRRTFKTAVTILHVGSSLRRADYRDVDVRIVLPDDEYAAFVERVNLLDLHVALSLWGQRVTGLPIDCQLQSQTESNAEPGGYARKPLNIMAAPK
jgi:hypothetical protein